MAHPTVVVGDGGIGSWKLMRGKLFINVFLAETVEDAMAEARGFAAS